MCRVQKLVILLTSCLLSSFYGHSQVLTQLQNVQVTFKLKNAGIDVDGRFGQVQATARVDVQNFRQSFFQGTLKTQSVNTQNTTRDEHLRSEPLFFHVSKYPEISMKSVAIGAKDQNGTYKVDWLLTIKGITRKVKTDVLISDQGGYYLLVTVFKLNRLDWKLGSRSLTMKNDVYVSLTGQLLKS